MQKITLLFTAVLLAAVFFTSCKDNELNGPNANNDCTTVKEWTDNQGKRFLLNEYSYANDKLTKITHYDFDGKKTENLLNYDAAGKLAAITDKVITPSKEETQYVTNFAYSPDGKVYQTDHFRVIDGNQQLLQTRIFYYENDKIIKLVSSGGVHWRYEYNNKGNVVKTFFQPATGNEYLLEEYTAYDDKPRSNTLEEVQVRQQMAVTATGVYFSSNNAVAYKNYNPDGSVLTTYTISREYNNTGKQVKVVTTTATNGTPTTATLETEYPTCK